MKQLKDGESLPRHNAIVDLKQIAIDRNDAFLANQIETWIQSYVFQASAEVPIENELIDDNKNKKEVPDYVKEELNRAVALKVGEVSSDTFCTSDDKFTTIMVRALALRATKQNID
jgi:hypothetical protein